ncbi:MAG: RagB/SusD family nutrient uptake outer membrane protein [Prevotella sp.]
MKKILNIVSVGLLSLSFASCSINSVENISEASTANFPATADDAESALAGIYEGLNQMNQYPQESFLYYSLLASDDQLGGGGPNDKFMQAEDMLCSYGANMTNDFWTVRYQGINRANTLIQALPNTKLTDAQKNQYMGEALFFRAFYYYELASMYGNVPLVTVPTGTLVQQGKVTVLWGQIIQDFRDAADLLPAVSTHNNGHVDKYCAEAMLARAWLFYTGMYGDGTALKDLTSTVYKPLTSVALPDGKTLTKQDVCKYIDDCVNNSGYSLVPDYRNLWAYTNRCTVNDYPYTKGKGLKWCQDDENEKHNADDVENMFAIKFNKLASWNTTIGYGNGYALHLGIRGGQDYANTFPFGQGWGAGPVAPNLISDWKAAEPNDMRRDASIQLLSELPKYKKGGWSDYIQETDYFEKKLAPVTSKDATQSGGYACCFEVTMYGADGWSNGVNMQTSNIHDLVLLRFADVLLMQSELEDNVSGINRVRARAGLAPIGSYSLTALQNERRWEFACEGLRWNDIRRWHIAAAALTKQLNQPIYIAGESSVNTAHNGGYAARYNATAGFMKMPDNAISIGSVVQNEGWSDNSSEYTGWR